MKTAIYFEIQVEEPLDDDPHWTPSYMRWMGPSDIETERVTANLRTAHIENDIRADYDYWLLRRVMRLP